MKLEFRNEIFKSDPCTIRELVGSTGFFRDDEINIAVELVAEAYTNGQENTGYLFVFAMYNDLVAGYACFGPTPCTIGTYDLYWIVVENNFRGRGIGKQLISHVEKSLLEKQARKLYIETSSTEKYDPTRNFYLTMGYTVEARLKDFYNTGDDKVIYSKYLTL